MNAPVLNVIGVVAGRRLLRAWVPVSVQASAPPLR